MSESDRFSDFGFKEKNRNSTESVNFGSSSVETASYGMYKLLAIR